MKEMFRRAHDHQGAAFVEIYQNCNVFNDGAFEAHHQQGPPRRHAHPARARRADPVRRRPASAAWCWHDRPRLRDRRRGRRRARTRILVHDEHRPRPGLAFALSRLAQGPTSRRRSACSATSTGPTTAGDEPAARGGPGATGPGDLDGSSRRCHLDGRVGPFAGFSRSAGRPGRCGAWGGRTSSSAASGRPGGDVDDLATVAGRSSTPASASRSCSAARISSTPCW